MTHAPLRLDSLWQDPKLNDITVRIIEKSAPLARDEEVQPSKKTRSDGCEEAKHVVPCSKVVLAGGSEYFKARLLSELEDGSKDFPLVVEDGEADAALAVLQTMYTGISEGTTAAKLVTMWKNADRLQATSAAMCIEALSTMDLDWDTAMMVRAMSKHSCLPVPVCCSAVLPWACPGS